jgi:hypothetical protein
MADREQNEEARDINGRLLELVRWACRERYEVLRLRPFMVRTPSINRGRGRRFQVLREAIPGRGVAPEQVHDPQRLHQLPEAIDFLNVNNLEGREMTPTPPLESDDENNLTLQVSMKYYLCYYRIIFTNYNYIICYIILITGKTNYWIKLLKHNLMMY